MKKRIFTLLLVAIMAIVILSTCFACYPKSAEQEIAEQQKELVAQANDAVGMPNITNYTEKRFAKDIIELRDDADLVTYAYMKNLDGKFTYLGVSIGFGLPYSVQYTNPETLQRLSTLENSIGDAYLVPQADPNGLYMPDGLSATWIILIDENTGDRYVGYFEDDLNIVQRKLPRRLCEEWSLPLNY